MTARQRKGWKIGGVSLAGVIAIATLIWQFGVKEGRSAETSKRVGETLQLHQSEFDKLGDKIEVGFKDLSRKMDENQLRTDQRLGDLDGRVRVLEDKHKRKENP